MANSGYLTVFMPQYLLRANGVLAPMSAEESKTVFHLFVSAVYFMLLVGALISDIWLEKYRTIISFLIFYCFGFFALVFDQIRLGLGTNLLIAGKQKRIQIFFISLALNSLGDALRDSLDPKLRIQ